MGQRNAFGQWTFDFDLGVGGLVLSKLAHRGFPLAQDVRVTRIWVGDDPYYRGNAIFPGQKWNARSLELGSTDLPNIGGVNHPEGQSSKAGFEIYPIEGAIEAKFVTKTSLPNRRNDTIRVSQRYLFSPYGKNPPHEPGAVLSAARFFPLIDFVVEPGPEDLPGVRYVRFDYRIEVTIDKTNKDLGGIFRDSETTPNPFTQDSISAALAQGTLAAVFNAAEKPLHHEVLGHGLRERTYDTKMSSVERADPQKRAAIVQGLRKLGETWDNVHIFPKRLDGSLPSTPGAFHCFHLHWRWGAVSAVPTGAGKLLLRGSGPQFAGLGWTSKQGGPLIDPAIPLQDLTFAITASNPQDTTLAARRNPSMANFPDLFTQQRTTPLDVGKGETLVLWMCFEVGRPHGKENLPWGGTIFPHGIYFGHSPEPSLLLNLNPSAGPLPAILSAVSGLTGPLQKARVSPNANPMPWWRNP